MSAPLLQIGVSKAAVAEARAALNDILRSQNDQPTKREAIKALASLCSVSGTTVSNCHFEGGNFRAPK